MSADTTLPMPTDRDAVDAELADLLGIAAAAGLLADPDDTDELAWVPETGALVRVPRAGRR